MATMVQAVRMALHYAEEHLGVTDIFGEDVGPPLGGVFTATQGLRTAWNSPLDERGIVGTAMGIAYAGGKPVCEIQFCDYAFNAIDLFLQCLGHDDAGSKRNHGKGKQHSDYDHRRRQHKDRFVRERRDPVLFGEDLDHVGQHLQQSKWADSIRSIAVLPESEQSSLDPDESGSQSQDHGNQRSAWDAGCRFDFANPEHR